MDINSAIGNYKVFLDKIFYNLKKTGFKLDEFKELDHIGYRTESLEKYEELKEQWKKFSSAYAEVQISGRPIMVYRLKDTLIYGEFKIHCLEILAPKEHNKYKEGLEHAEFVIKTKLQEFLEKHKDIVFGMDAFNKEGNPELKLGFEDCGVKFHIQSLLEIRGI